MLRIDDQAFRTDTGRQRNANEDSFFVRAPIFVVADGMGGAQAGEVASKAAADAFDVDLPDGPPEQVLRETILAANRKIHELAATDPSRAGMGTTLTAAIVDAVGEEVAIGHVGDSRAYRLRGGKLEQLTRDHSLVEEMRRKGQITDAQAEDHPQRSIITRALGPEPEVEPDLQTVPAAAGDVFLICSDGLTTMLGEEQIAKLLAGASSMSAAVRALVDEANRAGGRDNITALAFRLEDAAAPQQSHENATLIGSTAAEAGLTATEVRRRAAAAAARDRREQLDAKLPHRGLRRALKVLAVLVVLAALAFGAWYGNRQVWFLGTDDAGRVALYRGLPYELPFGIELYEERYASPIQTSSLPPRRQEAVTGHDLRSQGDAARWSKTSNSRKEFDEPARNREMMALVPVALLLTAGFAAVFAQENAQLDNLSLTYGAYFFAVCLATHFYLRVRLPNADPYLFPLAALLMAFGLVMVYRIDSSLARDQANWFVLGLVLFAATIHFLRDYDVLERYRYTIAAVGLLLLLAPRLPGVGQQVNGAYLGVKIGPLAFQPAEFSKICLVVFLASYLREHREVLIVGARRVLGVTLPPLKHFGPMLVVWGASMFMLVFIRDLGSSLMFFAAFLALLYVATGRFSFVVIGMAMFLVGAWFFAATVPHVHDRVEVWLNPYAHPRGSGYQILQSIFAQADGGLFGKGFAQSLITIPGTKSGAAAGRADRHDLLADRRRARPLRRLRGDPHLPVDRGPRLQDCPARRRRLLEAARHRPHRRLRDPGLRHRRRSHPGDPADRRHPALHQLRRQLDRRQLRPPGTAVAGV